MINIIREPNLNGKDFFVGDLHGYYKDLIVKLDHIGFDRCCDRLFCVGDLGDRGPQSLECLRLIHDPWFLFCARQP
ncbi:metallophosphoesterase [Zhongshania sp. BJYM1]|uniref:metallophosphoesterase n=1 Tax=Zhongshania aquatica TaxID=2965069 RepID=UPI003312FEE6